MIINTLIACHICTSWNKETSWKRTLKISGPSWFWERKKNVGQHWNIFPVFNSCSNQSDYFHYRILQLAYEGEWNRFRTHSYNCNNLRNNWKYSKLNISITIHGSNHNGFPLEFPIGYLTNGYWAFDNYVFIIRYIWYSRYI